MLERLIAAPIWVRVVLGAGAALVVGVVAVLWLRDDPSSSPTRLRERIVLTDDVRSELTGAVVSIRGEQPILLDVAVGGETCTFELRRPHDYSTTVDGDTWTVIVRRIDPEQRTVNVRVDRIPGSAEPDGCREQERG